MSTWSEAHRDNLRFLELYDEHGQLVASACHDGSAWDCAVLVRVDGTIASVVEWTDPSTISDEDVARACQANLWWAHARVRAGTLPPRVFGGRPLPSLRGPNPKRKRDELAELLPSWACFLQGAA